MDDEFKLCWKNFQDNIASGFQNLYDRGDLVDVTLACDGKLLHAHKIVLAICSPYFQEIFITNPCKHPIIILKDVTFNIMCELLEFMYQGVVNVKHTELQSFMKIGQLLQIKGLATNASSSAASSSSEKSASQIHHPEDAPSACGDTQSNSATAKSNANAGASDVNNSDSLTSGKLTSLVSVKSHLSPASSPSPMSFGASLNQQPFKSSPDNNVPPHHSYHAIGGGGSSGNGGGSSNLKRHIDLNSDALSVYSRKQYRRSIPSMEHSGEHSDGAEGAGLDSVNAEDYFLSSIPHIATNTSAAAAAAAAATLRNTFNPAAFGFDYNMYKSSSSGGGLGGVGGSGGGGGGANSSGPDYPNDLHMPNDYSKGYANHMDIPPIAPGEHWFHGKLEFMLSQRGKPLLVHDGHTFGIQYVRKDKKYWQCNLSRKFNCKARVTTTDTGEIIVTNNEHCHTEIRQHLRKDYQRNKVMMNALINLSTKSLAENLRRHNSGSLNSLSNFQSMVSHGGSTHNSHTASSTPSVGTNLSVHSQSPHADSPEQLSSIDFTKSGAGGTHSPSRTQHRNDAAEDDDNETPLDCGLRSTALDVAGKVNSADISDRNAPSSSDWKCKSDIADAQ